jgi:hypothetical protein
MVLKGRTKIRSLGRHLRGIEAGEAVVIGLTELDAHRDELTRAGFSDELVLGERVLPARLGRVSRHNAEGTQKPDKTKPMETAYRQIEWEWKEWDGTWHSKIVDVPYERYPRIFIPPPAVELEVAEDPDGDKVIVVDPLDYTKTNEEALLHRINLFRELFGEASILTEQLQSFVHADFRRLNWEVLPPGEMPWERLEEKVEPILREFGDRERPVAEHRLKVLTQDHKPDFTAVGRAGFRGYLVFGFEDKGIYVVESLEYGNATYVFGEDWERLSQMTKAEILNQDLQQARLIHREGWDGEIEALLR